MMNLAEKYWECLDKNVKLNLEICQYVMDIALLKMERDRLKNENEKLKRKIKEGEEK